MWLSPHSWKKLRLNVLQGAFPAALMHVSKGAVLVDGILREQGIDLKVGISAFHQSEHILVHHKT
jgi:hypothetical protein